MMKKRLTRLREKLNNRNGFTMVELMCAMMVMALLGMVVSVGISTAVRVQRESTFIAHSDVLTATLNTSMSDVLRYSTVNTQKTEERDDGHIYFSNQEYLISDGYIFVDENGHVGVHMNDTDDTVRYFISKGAYTGLEVQPEGSAEEGGFSLTYDKDTRLFRGTYTVREKAFSDPLTKETEFAFRCIA
ncbi:MAG: type II secretion system protein [Clostridia bacterium]|nr:type II secretion system protein [Clostridia bacterium]